jgi:hypothetical protein
MDLNELRKILFESGIKSIDNIHVNKLSKKYILNFLNDDKYYKRNIELNSNSNSKFKAKGGAYTESICIKNSFRQHKGECWHDAISMLYIFSDDIKEQVQKKLEDSNINDVPPQFQNTNQNDFDISDIELMRRGREQFRPLQLIKDNENRYYKLIKTYLFNIRKRFSSHYNEETAEDFSFTPKRPKAMRNISQKASTESCINLKLLLDTINSTFCQSDSFISTQRSTYSNRHSGGIDEYLIIINIINEYLLKDSYLTLSFFIFGCDNIIKELYTQNQLNTLISEDVDNLKLLFAVGNKLAPNHATSLFKCNNIYYYYDDNYINACKVDIHNIISVFTENNISNKFIVKYTSTIDESGYIKLDNITFLSVEAGEDITDANERTYEIHNTIDYLYIHSISFLKNNINDISSASASATASATASTYKFMLLQLDLMCIDNLYGSFSRYQTENDISNYTLYDINHVCIESISDPTIYDVYSAEFKASTNIKYAQDFIEEIYKQPIDIKKNFVEKKIKKYNFDIIYFESSLRWFYKNKILRLINNVDLKNNLLIYIADNSSSIYDFYNLLIVYLYAIDIPSPNDIRGMQMLLAKFNTEIPEIINSRIYKFLNL